MRGRYTVYCLNFYRERCECVVVSDALLHALVIGAKVFILLPLRGRQSDLFNLRTVYSQMILVTRVHR